MGNFGSATLNPINSFTNATGATIAVNDPSSVAITPDGATALVANTNQNTVTPVTLSTSTVGTAIKVGANPCAIAVTPDGSMAYVADRGSGTITPINLATKTAGAVIAVSANPDAIAITPDGTKAYVADEGSGAVTPITIATNTAGLPIAVGSKPDAVAITPDGTTAWVGNLGSNTITPINVSDETPGSLVAVNSPRAIAITPDGSKAYVANYSQGTVTPIGLSTRATGAAITVGNNPNWVAITPDQATAYVANEGSGTVTPINLSNDTARSNVTSGSEPDALAISPDEAPVASFTVTPAASGSASSFDASASTVAYGTIVSYAWNFGDGTVTTAGPTVSHTYATAGTYAVTLKETDSAGTSTVKVFTGQTMSRNGGPSAQSTRIVSITSPRRPVLGAHRLSVLLSASSVIITSQGNATILVSCPAAARRGCHGTITIRLAEPRRRGRAHAARCARGCRQLGSTKYEARAGQKIRVRVHIASYGRRLLALRKTLPVTVTATTISGGHTATTVRRITLRANTRIA